VTGHVYGQALPLFLVAVRVLKRAVKFVSPV
jgi:hypothetical protein